MAPEPFDEPLLTVESLAVDADKPYYDLFTDPTRELAAQRLEQFPSWDGDAGRGPHPSAR